MGVPCGRGCFSGPGDTLENRYLLQPENVAGQAAPKAAWESHRQRKVIGCAQQQAEKTNDHARHNDEFSVNAANHIGARRKAFSPRRSRFAQTGLQHHAHLLRRNVQACAAVRGGAQETGNAKR